MTVLIAILVMIAAALFGMMGLGSGIIYVPLMAWWGLDFATGAIPMGLLLSVATGGGVAYTYMRQRLVHLKTGIGVASAALLGAPFGVMALKIMPLSLVKIVLATAAFYVALRALRSGEPVRLAERSYLLTWTFTGLVGFTMGFFSALVGVGGGFLLVPVLLISGYPTKEAVGTTSLVVTISTLSAFLFHLPTADIPVRLALIFTCTALIGARAGAWWASRHANPKALRILIGVIIMFIALKVGGEGLIALAVR